MGTENTKPVVVNLNVEAFGGHDSSNITIPRADWGSLTPKQRAALCERLSKGHVADWVKSWWAIDDPDDMESTGVPHPQDRPAVDEEDED